MTQPYPPAHVPSPDFQQQPPAPRKVERPSPWTGLANAWLMVVAVVGVIINIVIQQDVKLDEEPMLLMWLGIGGIVVVAVLALLIGIIQWRTTTFIVDDEFRIEKRFITTSTTRIDFTKVQSVDITRPLVARILGLAEVKIDVGGEGGQALRFLKRDRAELLRDTLLARMEHDDPAPAATPDGMPAPAQVPGGEEVIYQAKTSNIVLGSFLSHGFGVTITVVILLTITLGPLGVAASLGWLWLTLIAVAWQIPKALLQNWEFAIVRTAKGLRIQRGALTRVQTTLRPERVQTISIRQSLLMRWAGMATVRMSVLGNQVSESEEQNNDGINILVPFGKFDEVRYVVGLIWPDVDPTAFTWWKQSPRGRWLTWFGQRWFAVEESAIAHRRAMLNETVEIVPHARVQGLGIRRGPLQQLARVAAVDVQVIDGAPDVSISHLDTGHARKLFEEELWCSRRARQATNRRQTATVLP